MNLYTILMNFEDRTTLIEQYESSSEENALFLFIENAKCLNDYNRKELLQILKNRKNLLIHLSNIKWFWIMDFWTDLFDSKDFSNIYWWYIVQTDKDWPIRKN